MSVFLLLNRLIEQFWAKKAGLFGWRFVFEPPFYFYLRRVLREIFFLEAAKTEPIVDLMKRVIIFLALLAAAASARAIKIINGPYLQMVGDDCATVVWQTDVDALSWVEIAPADGAHFYAKERPKFFESPMGKKRMGKNHTVSISGLKSGAKYIYRAFSREVTGAKGNSVYYGDVASTRVYKEPNPFFIKTFSPDAESLRFTVVNDIHENTSRLATFLSDCADDDFVVLNGDMVNSMRSREQLFDTVMNQVTKSTRSSKPIFMARGNHETRGPDSESFMEYFPSPTGKPYYAKRIGKFFFIFLDGGEDKPDSDVEYYGTADFDKYREDQAKWLEGVVQSPEFKSALKRVVITHIPPHWGAWHGSLHFRKVFAPVLKGKKIDLYITAHLHGEYRYYEPDADFDAPAVVNSNMERIKVSLDAEKILLEFHDDKLQLRRSVTVK